MNEIENVLSQIENFQFVHEHLFTSAQPTAEQLSCIKAYGINTVINLALNDPQHAFSNEDQICLDLGLNYIQLPISWETPSDSQCIFALDMIDHLVQDQMIWVHCHKNYTVSSLMYLYRQYYMGTDLVTAQELRDQIWQPNNTWTGLIHAVMLQLQGRKATKELQHSLEMVHL